MIILYIAAHVLGYFHAISGVLDRHEVTTSCAGGYTGSEKMAHNIDLKHLKNVYQLGLKI